jgi:photosystem II stability/assembly factor-like uncharacterized protein
MKTRIQCIVLLILLVTTQESIAQSWMANVQSDNPTFQEMRDAFSDYWRGKPIVKGQGYKQFKRWEWYWESRILPNGQFPKSSVTWDAHQRYRESHRAPVSKRAETIMSSANWTNAGPSTSPGGYYGIGRINCMAFHPTDANTFWVGTPSGGLWKTVDAGSTWSTSTDNLPVLGVSDIAIDPTNANIMYIATGDGDMGSLFGMISRARGDSKSIGVLKSTDGGTTWSATGLSWSAALEKLMRRLLISPTNPKVLLAAASDGVWRTTNGGETWANVQAGYFKDMEFKPGDDSIVYASTYGNSEIYRSTDNGASWTSVATLPGVIRVDLAVSAARPELVDALCVNTSRGLAGLWTSTNSGASFTQYLVGSESKNMLNVRGDATGVGGQGHYDLAHAINPDNEKDIWIGGINVWSSMDGGSNWILKSAWIDSANAEGATGVGHPDSVAVVHADCHWLAFHPLQRGTVFACNDGVIYRTTDNGARWTDITNGLAISQMYRIGAAQTVAANVICGLQDNGSKEFDNNEWNELTGGDGMECLIDYSNESVLYSSVQFGKIIRIDKDKDTAVVISTNIPGGQEPGQSPDGQWVTPFVIDPVNSRVLFAGYDKVYKTTDQGDSWSAISPELTSELLRYIAVAPSDPNTIYVATHDTIARTTDGGATWSYVSLGNPDLKGFISYIAVDPTNTQRVYVTLSGYSPGNKVFMSPDGGASWANYSGTLPNVPANCIVYQKGSNEGLYIGTDVGVFYRDATMTDWVPYQTGLPVVLVTELEISYFNNKLWAGTFGRGLWSADLYSPSVGVESQSIDDDVYVFPNPNTGLFTVQVPEGMQYDIVVFNVLGEQVYEERDVDASQRTIELCDVTSGMYLVRLSIANTTITKNVVVNE